ncbi:hypothetical protein GQ42DRAFT_30281 [Ramicandelaber brevisporus]|nr:hypothetical protein GQ42DRAFT_30281 [Ramicandelaber brevisporus]
MDNVASSPSNCTMCAARVALSTRRRITVAEPGISMVGSAQSESNGRQALSSPAPSAMLGAAAADAMPWKCANSPSLVSKRTNTRAAASDGALATFSSPSRLSRSVGCSRVWRDDREAAKRDTSSAATSARPRRARPSAGADSGTPNRKVDMGVGRIVMLRRKRANGCNSEPS